jgi:hypothetical protein
LHALLPLGLPIYPVILLVILVEVAENYKIRNKLKIQKRKEEEKKRKENNKTYT